MEEDGKLYIKEDVSDWRDETLQNESIVTSEEDIVKAMKTDGNKTAEIARSVVVSRLLGYISENIISPNKVLINLAAQGELAKIMRKYTYLIQKSDGNTIEVTDTIGGVATETKNGFEVVDNPVAEDTNGGADLTPCLAPRVPINTPNGQERVLRQIFYRIYPDIRSHLAKLKASNGNVREIASQLKEKIDEIVDEIA